MCGCVCGCGCVDAGVGASEGVLKGCKDCEMVGAVQSDNSIR